MYLLLISPSVLALSGHTMLSLTGILHVLTTHPLMFGRVELVFIAAIYKKLGSLAAEFFIHNHSSATLYATTGDTLYGYDYLSQHYAQSSSRYTGNISVPVLWDMQQRRIVNNESSEIIRMFNTAFNKLTGNKLDYYPAPLRDEIDRINTEVYTNINNGVYKTGFATTQAAYEKNAQQLFLTLDRLEQRLSQQRYLTGEQITEADWRLFTTLIRFDAVYHTHFKCNLQLLKEYDALYHYMLDLYQQDGIAQTVNLAHIKRHYYASHLSFNPYGIVPVGHRQDWNIAHQREHIKPEASS